MKRSMLRGFVWVAIMTAVAAGAGAEPVSHDIRPGYGVDEIRWLSDYHPALKGTRGDTPIYVMRGDEPGGSVLVLGGTHSNEIAGVMAAVLLVERGEARQGTAYVIPHANNSAARRNDRSPLPYEGTVWLDPYEADLFALPTSSGMTRWFHYGSRITQEEDQGVPDSEVYVHAQTGYELAGWEARNLNRAYPGLADGTLTQQIAYAITQLIKTEAVDVEIDLHEAPTQNRLANMLVCHPRALDIGLFTVMDLEMAGLTLKIEASSSEFRGLSHRELGDATDVYAFLIESPNPAMDYVTASAPRAVDPLENLGSRVWLDLVTIQGLLATYTMMGVPGAGIEIAYPFDLNELRGAELGPFLR